MLLKRLKESQEILLQTPGETIILKVSKCTSGSVQLLIDAPTRVKIIHTPTKKQNTDDPQISP